MLVNRENKKGINFCFWLSKILLNDNVNGDILLGEDKQINMGTLM